jgi:2-polyprenyl-3-methyl-5-hydroxy-6-metoxy-1,4-benzoquinol methylase
MDQNSIKSILDFGCGNGEMLEVFHSNFEIDLMGLEPENGARVLAQKRGFNVLNSISEFVNNSKKFDLITLFHVVEHLYEPSDILNELKNILITDCIILIETPNSQYDIISLYESDAFRNFTYWSHHPYLYSNKGLEILLNSAGFEILFNTGVQRYSLDNHLYWLSKNKPGGHFVWDKLFNKEVLDAYNKNLVQNKVQDTLWLAARAK